MASAIIHLATAKKLKHKFNIKNELEFYLGSIAPDIAKHINLNKADTHFFDNEINVSNISSFKKKYQNYLESDFLKGYLVHLETDNLWYSTVSKAYSTNTIKLLDGTYISADEKQISSIVYRDYTGLNQEVIDKYELDLKLFYNDISIPNVNMEEFDLNKLNILTEKMSDIVVNSIDTKEFVFDINTIEDFIEECIKKIHL